MTNKQTNRDAKDATEEEHNQISLQNIKNILLLQREEKIDSIKCAKLIPFRRHGMQSVRQCSPG